MSGARTLATAIGLLALIGEVALAATLVNEAAHFWSVLLRGCALLVPLAIGAWSGRLWQRGAHPVEGPQTWQDWLKLGLWGVAAGVVFAAFDLMVQHPGLSLGITLGALAIPVLALPGALRAWLLARWQAPPDTHGAEPDA